MSRQYWSSGTTSFIKRRPSLPHNNTLWIHLQNSNLHFVRLHKFAIVAFYLHTANQILIFPHITYLVAVILLRTYALTHLGTWTLQTANKPTCLKSLSLSPSFHQQNNQAHWVVADLLSTTFLSIQLKNTQYPLETRITLWSLTTTSVRASYQGWHLIS